MEKNNKTVKTLGVLEQNKIEDGITITFFSDNPKATGERTNMPLSDFLLRFETPKERATVRAAVHAVLRSSRRDLSSSD